MADSTSVIPEPNTPPTPEEIRAQEGQSRLAELAKQATAGQQILQTLRERYPKYKNVPDQELAQGLASQYPVYRKQLQSIMEPGEITQSKGLLGRIFERADIPTTLRGVITHKGINPISAAMLPMAAQEEAVTTLGEKVGIKRPVSRGTGEPSDQPDLGDLMSRLQVMGSVGRGVGNALGRSGFGLGTRATPPAAAKTGGLASPEEAAFNQFFKTPEAQAIERDATASPISGGATGGRIPPGIRYIPPTGQPTPTTWQSISQAAGSIADKLPQDYPMWLKRPTTGVITAFEKARHDMDQIMGGANKLSGLYSTTHDDWVQWEQQAFLAGRLNGNSMRAALAQLPPEMREVVEYMNSNRPMAKWARRFLSGEKLVDEPLYITPHIVQEDFDKALQLTRKFQGLSSDFKATLGAFEKDREYNTMLEGMVRGGHQYVDARMAYLYRIWADAKLIHTAKFLRGMVLNGDVFASERAAQAASATHQAFKIEAFPGSKEWWTATREEALWIKHHIQDPHVMGSASRLVQFGNQWFRNFNLWNPLPHFTKNMLYKYGFSGGDPRFVFQDMREIANNTNPTMVALYKKYMPYTEGGSYWQTLRHPIQGAQSGGTIGTTGGTAYDLFHDTMQRISGLSDFQKFMKIVSAPNNASSRLLFSKWDPWLKYSRFKQYVENGVHPQDAANQVHMDLIRYSMRSDAIDIWKAIPFNFFVPWRVGTVQSMVKNMQQAPYQAALWVAGWDLIREMYYRRTGNTFHVPADYIVDPLVRVVESAGGGYTKKQQTPVAVGSKMGSELTKLTATTALFGPGGQYSGQQLANIIKLATTGKANDPLLKSMFWGFALIGDPEVGIKSMLKFEQDGDPQHLVDLFSAATFATHNALKSPPHRWTEAIPEFTPIFTRSEEVRKAEAKNRQIQIHREQRENKKGTLSTFVDNLLSSISR